VPLPAPERPWRRPWWPAPTKVGRDPLRLRNPEARGRGGDACGDHRLCREHLAHFKVPRTIVFGELPKTSTGKIQKFVLRERADALSRGAAQPVRSTRRAGNDILQHGKRKDPFSEPRRPNRLSTAPGASSKSASSRCSLSPVPSGASKPLRAARDRPHAGAGGDGAHGHRRPARDHAAGRHPGLPDLGRGTDGRPRDASGARKSSCRCARPGGRPRPSASASHMADDLRRPATPTTCAAICSPTSSSSASWLGAPERLL